MSGAKKVSRRHGYSRNKKSSASRRKSSIKKLAQHEDVNVEERTPTPSWAAQDSEDEFWADGYNTQGYDRQGFSRSGFNKHGFMRRDYGPDGFNAYGFDTDGYDREGRNILGLTRADYDVDGYDAYGLDCYGYDRQGLNKYGYRAADYDANGLDKHGYTNNGLYHGVPGTALVPLRHAMIRKGSADPVYYTETYERLKEHANMVVVNAHIEREKLIKFQDLVTDLSLKWTAWTTLYALGLQ